MQNKFQKFEIYSHISERCLLVYQCFSKLISRDKLKDSAQIFPILHVGEWLEWEHRSDFFRLPKLEWIVNKPSNKNRILTGWRDYI